MNVQDNLLTAQATGIDTDGIDVTAMLLGIARHWVGLGMAVLVGGAAGYAASFAFTPTYLSSVLFIAPQQQTGGAGSALASLGALSSLIGGNTKTSADQYVSMLESVKASDDIIRQFGLVKVYDKEYMDETRKKLSKLVRISVGKKDGLIRVDVEDNDPKRAAAMANAYVDELRTMNSHLAVTEAQQRRVLFERLLDETRKKLVTAQVELEGSGYTSGALKVDPKSAAAAYANLRADLIAAQVKAQTLRGSLADTAPAVQQQMATVNALSTQIGQLEASQASDKSSPDYIGRYRDFKYQETLFDLYAKQFELARIDEARDGLIQVVDEGLPAEHKYFPRRSLISALGAAIALLVAAGSLWRRTARSPVARR